MKIKDKGFTLIELLIVIAIIGLLASVVFATLASSRIKARDAKRAADVRQLLSGLELYYLANNTYPIQAAPQTITNGIVTGIGLLSPTFVSNFTPAPTPNDGTCSAAQNSYVYTSASGSTYTITFCLGGATGNFAAGTHTAGPNGIQ